MVPKSYMPGLIIHVHMYQVSCQHSICALSTQISMNAVQIRVTAPSCVTTVLAATRAHVATVLRWTLMVILAMVCIHTKYYNRDT